MNTQLDNLTSLCKTLHLDAVPVTEFLQGLPDDLTPLDMLTKFLGLQYNHKQNQATDARIKRAGFPRVKTFEE